MLVSSHDYTWRNGVLGGGGYVTGLVIHPRERNLVYIRTDVGGAYRYDPVRESWLPLLDSVPFQDRNFLGVDGLALAPSNPDLIAVAAGQYTRNAPSDVLLSQDRGRTWRRTGLNKLFGGNQPHRMAGECLAFDPADARRLLVGTRLDGLFLTRDGGQTWKHLEAVPSGTPQVGIRAVAFGAGGALATVDGVGLYFSRDSDLRHWEPLSGASLHINRLAVANDGSIFVTARDPGGVWVRRAGEETWREITPLADRNYHALEVDPLREGRVLVSPSTDPSGCRFRLPVFLSEKGGEGWRVLSSEPDWSTAPAWMPASHLKEIRPRPTSMGAWAKRGGFIGARTRGARGRVSPARRRHSANSPVVWRPIGASTAAFFSAPRDAAFSSERPPHRVPRVRRAKPGIAPRADR